MIYRYKLKLYNKLKKNLQTQYPFKNRLNNLFGNKNQNFHKIKQKFKN